MSELQKRLLQSSVSAGGLPPKGPGPVCGRGRERGRGFGRKPDYSPLSWESYFSDKRLLNLGPRRYCVYEAKSEGCPDDGTVLVLLHGGGYSGLTWSLMAQNLIKSCECRILSPDLRGHGDSRFPEGDDETNLDAATVADEIVDIIDAALGGPQTPRGHVVLVGHSMGGALAVHTALSERIAVSGLCVIDVVEGTALDSLTSMQGFLRGRPKSFPSLEYAIEWSLRTGQVRNYESSRVSMPGQLKSSSSGMCGVHDVGKLNGDGGCGVESRLSLKNPNRITEENEESEEGAEAFKSPESENRLKTGGYEWRIDLAKTEKHWEGWFRGLSSKFLSVKAAKLLLLAGVDRLDRDLTVGQMQGQFQMQVLPQAGHAVHEDAPDKVAEILAGFLVRNRFSKALDNFQIRLPAC